MGARGAGLWGHVKKAPRELVSKCVGEARIRPGGRKEIRGFVRPVALH